MHLMNRKTFLLYILSGLFFIFLAFICFNFRGPANTSSSSEFMINLEDHDLVNFLEAINQIREKGLFLDPIIPKNNIFQDILKGYLSWKDPFSDYLTRDEFFLFRQFQDQQYIGIGMEIQKDHQGRIVCFPYPESPAERKGIRAGDYLEKINQRPVNSKSIFTVASMVKECKGTKVELSVRTIKGIEKQLSVPCELLEVEYVKKQKFQDVMVVQIHAFTRSSAIKLEKMFFGWEKHVPVIIDLRGNWGGDLNAAMDCAELFLEKGQKIAIINTRTSSKTYESKNSALDLEYPVYLFQDAATASAAEVFAAALIDNKQAVSIGRSTFGKGTTQDIIELSDGSALIITTGHLKTPNGFSYQSRGLTPMHSLYEHSSDTLDYLSKVKELRSAKSKY